MTHEAGIEAAQWLMYDVAYTDYGSTVIDPDAAERIIQSYLSASGMVLVPMEMTPEMVKNVQVHSELGAYVTSNWAGAYDVMEEYWAKLLAKAPDPFKSKP